MPTKRPPRTAALSDQLRAAIEAHGTPYGLALEAGVAPSVLSRFVSGERGLTTGTLDALAGPLGLKLIRAARRGRRGPRAG